jgi:hypothetical protein
VQLRPVVVASLECVAGAGRRNGRRDPSLAQDDTKKNSAEFGIWTLTRRVEHGGLSLSGRGYLQSSEVV